MFDDARLCTRRHNSPFGEFQTPLSTGQLLTNISVTDILAIPFYRVDTGECGGGKRISCGYRLGGSYSIYSRCRFSLVTFVGETEESRLRNVYAQCRALLFAADEDFGMVPLEFPPVAQNSNRQQR
jgi:hypothetical protein